MTITTTTDTKPRVWIGCLACYNEGRLVGDWHDASDADEVTTADVHSRASSHEELWCFDIENIPVRREMSPHEAAEWGRVFDEVDEHQREALYAWVASGDYVAEGTGDLPSTSDFQERYCGHWEGFDDYARELADDIGLLHDVPEEIATYFDWDSWIRDLGFDYSTCGADTGGIYVFRAL
ncbi:antirestriction protein ArdA [Mycetocola reblochoni]|uniref:antirestriction protein ArdA n=1 Tax=Mycetocola reblochoni TaxID=331618 RepID=UPI003F96AD4D